MATATVVAIQVDSRCNWSVTVAAVTDSVNDGPVMRQ